MYIFTGAYAQKISKNFKVNASEKENWKAVGVGYEGSLLWFYAYPFITFRYILLHELPI